MNANGRNRVRIVPFDQGRTRCSYIPHSHARQREVVLPSNRYWVGQTKFRPDINQEGISERAGHLTLVILCRSSHRGKG